MSQIKNESSNKTKTSAIDNEDTSKTNTTANNKVNSSKPVNIEAEIIMLKELFSNADIGKSSIDAILKKIDDTTLKNILFSQYESYNDITGKIASQLNKNGETPKSNSSFGKAIIWSSININTLFDKSISHIADIIIKGNNVGIVDINKELNEYFDMLSKDTLDLASDLLVLEQRHIEDLKPYL